jgi:hypothetical protein
MTWLGAGLPNIDSVGAGREQPLQLIVLFPVGGIHIDVQTQRAGPGLVSPVEDDRGLQAAEADARRPDLYACFVALQLDMAQYLAPEPRQQIRQRPFVPDRWGGGDRRDLGVERDL